MGRYKMKVLRAELIQNLESVSAGLSPAETIQQSSCFAFKKGEVFTFNGETACRNKSLFPKQFTGAVGAKKLMELLRKLIEDEIEVEFSETELRIIGKKRRAGLKMEQEVLLPIDSIEIPKKWFAVHDDFPEAIELTNECVGKDDTQTVLMCIHVHPNHVEACDQIQATRYKVDTGVKNSLLVRREGIRHIITLGMSEMAETENWLHFRNSAGLQLSCCTYLENYPELGQLFRVKGHEAVLPKGLAEAAEKADLFSSEDADNNLVQVELRPGKLRLKGEGVTGWYSEVKQLKYSGEPLTFLISPRMLMEITKKHSKCIVSENCLMVNGSKFRFVTTLAKEK